MSGPLQRPLRSAALREIAGAIGRADAVRLADRLGGQRIYVPRDIPADHLIAQAIGPEQARKFANFFHGMWMELPVASARRRRQRVQELGAAGELTRQQIAAETGYSERQVYNILGNEQDKGQADLFS